MSEPYRCLLVDDEPLALQLIASHIDKIDALVVADQTQSPIEALTLLKDNEYDLIFLDIQMPVLTGLELLRTMRNPPAVIFTTAYRDYAVESYDLNALDYLIKPITFVRFVKAVDKFLQTMETTKPESIQMVTAQEQKQDSLFVNVNKRYVKVVFDKISYVESVKDYIHIHIGDDTIITKEKISEFELKLPPNFLRIHRSFIVNLDRITAFTSLDIEIGTKEIPIGKSYKSIVSERLK